MLPYISLYAETVFFFKSIFFEKFLQGQTVHCLDSDQTDKMSGGPDLGQYCLQGRDKLGFT